MKIWCVEDDAQIREIELYTLTQTGFEAKGFTDAKAFFDALESDTPDLIILDVMLPDTDGVEILRRLKSAEATRELPVIMATARGMEYDKIRSLDLGADDYLVKPFGMLEMVSRIKAVSRRCMTDKTGSIKIKGLEINTRKHTVTADGARVALTYKEFELLKLFMAHPGIVYTREQLFNNVWGMDYCVETRTVDMHIRTLRQKIEPYGALIETVRGVGYRMEGSI